MPLSSKLTWKGDRVAARALQAGQRGTYKALDRLLADSVEQAPLRDGILRGSAAVVANEGAAGVGGAVVFDTVYAARQHEELDWTHRDGKARYLADPLEQNAAVYLGIIAKEIRSALT